MIDKIVVCGLGKMHIEGFQNIKNIDYNIKFML